MKLSAVRKLLPLALLGTIPLGHASTTLSADSVSDAYSNIRNKLGSTIEAPDCAHPEFGPHITQEQDATLGKQVFVFHAHVKPDNDRCLKSDRQRNEIKVDAQSPAAQRAVQGDRMTYNWKFKLDSGFQASPDFTHLHQVKPVGGDDDMPLITLIARKDSMELTQYNYSNSRTILRSAPLSAFRGEWVDVRSTLTAGRPGTYSMTITRVRDGAVLLTYSSGSIDMWRSGTTYVRPKWGIYRSLNNPSYLRDEKVRFDQFCIAKGSDTCGGANQVAAPSFSVAPGAYAQPQTVAIKSTTADATIRYTTGDAIPSCSAGTVYSSPVPINATTRLSAIACKSGMAASAPASGTWTIGSSAGKLALMATTVTASAHDGNLPANSVDGNLATRWSAQGDGQWIQYDLQAQKMVSLVKLAWHNGGSRKSRFEIQVSNDGKVFTTVFSGTSSGTTAAAETYDFTDVPARFVRVLGHGNSANLWNSITETQVHGLN
jgi:hypothetical protein